MNFDQKLENYADLLVSYALNIQEGQILNINTEPENRVLAMMILELAYQKGSKFVDLNLNESKAGRSRILYSKNEFLEYVPSFIPNKFDEYISNKSASLSLISPEDPDILEGLNPQKINALRIANYKARKKFYDEGIDKSNIHWTVASAATYGWAKKLFPGLNKEEAKEKLWDELFKICRVDREDYLKYWEEHDNILKSRANFLNNSNIKEFKFIGPKTDLIVGLSDQAIFKGGKEKSTRDAWFEPNIPTEECFTTPDYSKTNGIVSATRPFRINGQLIVDLELEFKDGKIVNFSAKEGFETFKSAINSDEGASRLGEVALVGIDSPIFQSGIVFDEILLDENAACHIAIGSAYKFCVQNGTSLTDAELANLGVNESSVHTDIMISDQNTDVFITSFSNTTKQIIKNGQWL